MVIYEFGIIFQLITCQEVMFQALWLHTGENYIVIVPASHSFSKFSIFSKGMDGFNFLKKYLFLY